MEYQFETEKINFFKRTPKVIFASLPGMIIIPLLLIIRNDSYMWTIPLWMIPWLLIIFYLVLRFYRTYVYGISCDKNKLYIRYLLFNNEKEIIYERDKVAIALEITISRGGKKMFTLRFKQKNTPSIRQLSVQDWNDDRIREAYESLIKWKNNS